MRCLVTGAAGFIGSHLCERLVTLGHEVTGIDALTSYYDVSLKRRNLDQVAHGGATTIVGDLLSVDLPELVGDMEVIFHLAGQPGVRASWGDTFDEYCSMNVLSTQRLLEAARGASVERFIYASSSSVYGEAVSYPCNEGDPTAPVSPYGVTKLAGEHLCRLYAHNWSLPTVSLRFFTVYGPRQRPDMAMNRFLTALLEGRALTLWGTGEQIRDFTFVSDIVEANIAAAFTPNVAPGSFFNVAGGSSISVNALVELIGGVTGITPSVDRLPAQPGDVSQTGASIERIHAALGWRPKVSTADGVRAQWDWHRTLP